MALMSGSRFQLLEMSEGIAKSMALPDVRVRDFALENSSLTTESIASLGRSEWRPTALY